MYDVGKPCQRVVLRRTTYKSVSEVNVVTLPSTDPSPDKMAGRVRVGET
jgi:hypothetical protein